LKVLGFTRREIAFSLLWETMTLTLVGVLIGLALGYPFMLAVMKLNIVELVEYLYTITWQSYLYSFLLTFVVAFVVNAWLSYRTGQVAMVESLKSVE
jgi:putative ABC transport system permease protein